MSDAADAAKLPRPKPLALAIASGLAGSVLVVGCAEERLDAAIYADIPACIAAGQEPLACEAAFQEAGRQHAALAPRFVDRGDCEAEFGRGACGTAEAAAIATPDAEGRPTQEAGGGFFYPLMVGYLMGSMMRGAGAAPHQPLYRSADGNWRNPAGSNLGARSGPVSVARTALAPPPTRTTVTSRGGFTAPRASGTYGG